MHGRNVVVSGAASGIGRATAQRLQRDGYGVVGLDVDEAGLAGLDLDVAAVVDVTDREAVAAATDAAAEELGGLHAAVTCAGIVADGDGARIGDLDPAVFDRVVAVHLGGTFAVLHAALPHIEAAGGGAVVTVASTAALGGHGVLGGYTAAKGGIVALTRLVAVQYAGVPVRANCVCPGATDTPMVGPDGGRDELLALLGQGVPMGRVARPEEVAATIAWLLGDDASYLTGVVVPVDGGETIA